MFLSLFVFQPSRAVFVKFEWMESSVPAVGKVEDRHVEHKHRVVSLATAPNDCAQFSREISSLSFHFVSVVFSVVEK
jgi:hypothetical protein